MKRPDRRPISLNNEALQLISGTGLLCLLAGCFIAFNLGDRSVRPLAFLVAAFVYDLALRWFFFEKEVYRVCKTSKCRRDTAVERVRRRASYGVATVRCFNGWHSSRQRKADAPQQTTTIEQIS